MTEKKRQKEFFFCARENKYLKINHLIHPADTRGDVGESGGDGLRKEIIAFCVVVLIAGPLSFHLKIGPFQDKKDGDTPFPIGQEMRSGVEIQSLMVISIICETCNDSAHSLEIDFSEAAPEWSKSIQMAFYQTEHTGISINTAEGKLVLNWSGIVHSFKGFHAGVNSEEWWYNSDTIFLKLNMSDWSPPSELELKLELHFFTEPSNGKCYHLMTIGYFEETNYGGEKETTGSKVDSEINSLEVSRIVHEGGGFQFDCDQSNLPFFPNT